MRDSIKFWVKILRRPVHYYRVWKLCRAQFVFRGAFRDYVNAMSPKKVIEKPAKNICVVPGSVYKEVESLGLSPNVQDLVEEVIQLREENELLRETNEELNPKQEIK